MIYVLPSPLLGQNRKHFMIMQGCGQKVNPLYYNCYFLYASPDDVALVLVERESSEASLASLVAVHANRLKVITF